MAGLRSAEQYRAQIRALLPLGPAWDPERSPEIEKNLSGLSLELARIDARAFDLINETDPAGVSELMPDWEGGQQLGQNRGQANYSGRIRHQ